MSKQIKVINYIETMRVFTCPYCWNSNHTLRKCYHFIQYKNITSKYSYCQKTLEPNDALGYCAGGIIICSKNKFLMLNEIRKGENKLNFIGGGRETVVDIKNRKYMEKPHQTIINELTEELNEIYYDNDNNIKRFREYIIRQIYRKFYDVIWISESKMVYYVVNVPAIFEKLIYPMETNHDKIQGIKWVKSSNLTPYNLHHFSKLALNLYLENK